MDLGYTDEQRMLREMVTNFLRDHYAFEDRQKALSSGATWRPDIWQMLAGELGLFGMNFPASMGGLGGGAVEAMIIMEEAGRALMLEPLIETIVIAPGVARRCASPAMIDFAARTMSGTARCAWCHEELRSRDNPHSIETTATRESNGFRITGRKTVVFGAPLATDLFVVARLGGNIADPAGLALFLIDAETPGISIRAYKSIDGRSVADISFDNVWVAQDSMVADPDIAPGLIAEVRDEAVAATCADSLGVMRNLVSNTAAYLRERNQFGKPLTAFQVLRHRMVDMWIDVEQAESMTTMAALHIGEAPAERAKAVSAAKAFIDRVGMKAGKGAVQSHGGMGITSELAIGHYFNRLIVSGTRFGSADYHVDRYGRLSLVSDAISPPVQHAGER